LPITLDWRVRVHQALRRDPDVAAWWATEVECASALTRLERDGDLTHEDMADAMGRLRALAAAWQEVLPAVAVRRAAIRMLRLHPLRAADAFQLAAASIVAEDHPESLPFVTLDDRLAVAAVREGFPVERPGLRDR
jgi:predicted nucleic acid-binding protein